MVVQFKSGLYNNYTQQNIIDILSVAAQQNFMIYNLMMSPYDYILVEGDIHKSQWTSDNTQNNYWFKIKGFASNGYPLKELKAAHIYVCFKQISFDYRKNQYMFGMCINPEPYKGTDIANISNLNGYWEFVNITYGLSPANYFQQTNKNVKKVKTPQKKKLEIIDPKTGKPIIIKDSLSKGSKKVKMMSGGSNNSNETTVDNLKINGNEVDMFVKEVGKSKSLSLLKVIKIFQKIIKKRARAKSVPLKGGSKK